MKTKNFIGLIILGIVSMLFINSCSGQDAFDILSVENSLMKNNYLWSSTIKEDTIIHECIQTISVNYQGKVTNLNPKAKIVFYKNKDVVPMTPGEDPTSIFKTSNEETEETSISPTIHTFNKEFIFEDGEVITVQAYYEVYTSADIDATLNVDLPYISIESIDFVSVKTSSNQDRVDEYKVDLAFSFDWKLNYSLDGGKTPIDMDYLKVVLSDTDNFLETTYNQGYEWVSDNSLILTLEKNEIWSQSGKKTTKYQSKPLEFYLSSGKNKTLEVSSLNFSTELTTNTLNTNDLSGDGWNITQTEIKKVVKYSNAEDVFDDSFTYPSYDVSFYKDGKTFTYDLSSSFSYNTSRSKNNESTTTLTTLGNLIVANNTFNSSVVSVLNIKENQDPTPDVDDDETRPEHGRILSHFVSAVFDVSNKVTKKCVVVRYEQGYDWGICEYNEYYPKTFTYTQSGYSGFNSAAICDSKGTYRLARAIDTSNAIYWYKENNELVSAIDAATCKAIGWKNLVNGKYKSAMDGYKENFSSDSYTLTLTAPDGSTRTFKSKKTN